MDTKLRENLRRGRGCAARAAVNHAANDGAANAPDVADLIYDCVRDDPRWDWQVESRGLYYARLIVDLNLPVEPIGPRQGPSDALAIDTLVELVRLGRRDAIEPLRGYASTDPEATLGVLAENGDPALLAGLGEIAATRCDAATLRAVALACPPAFNEWARSYPGLRRAAAMPRRAPVHREDLSGRSDAELCALASAPAVRELGRRRSPKVLDLAEGTLGREAGALRGALHRAVRELGPAALHAARRWAGPLAGGRPAEAGTDDECRAYVGVDVLAAHGTDSDAPVLMEWLDRSITRADWNWTVTPVIGLGRLAYRPAVPAILHAWETTPYSYLRVHLLRALTGIDRHIAEPYAIEALWDCEAEARRHAAGTVPRNHTTAERLARLAAEPAEDPDVRVAVALGPAHGRS